MAKKIDSRALNEIALTKQIALVTPTCYEGTRKETRLCAFCRLLFRVPLRHPGVRI
jgi:hypothetical protein